MTYRLYVELAPTRFFESKGIAAHAYQFEGPMSHFPFLSVRLVSYWRMGWPHEDTLPWLQSFLQEFPLRNVLPATCSALSTVYVTSVHVERSGSGTGTASVLWRQRKERSRAIEKVMVSDGLRIRKCEGEDRGNR